MRIPNRNDNESRPTSIGGKHSSSTRGKKRRRRNAPAAKSGSTVNEFVARGGTFSSLAQNQPGSSSAFVGTTSVTDQVRFHASNKMANGLGKNRLAMGFTNPSTNGNGVIQTSKMNMSGAADARSPSVTGQSADSAIEISDDDEDMEDSEGGIVLNVDDRAQRGDKIDLSDEQESGEISSDGSNIYPSAIGAAKSTDHDSDIDGESFIIDSNPGGVRKRLVDLTPSQQEEQLRYAFYYLERDQVDLNRSVVCLLCFTEGHIHVDCQQKALFPTNKSSVGQQVKLWISCCVCASRSHLVGDCPEASKAGLDKWSLSNFKQGHIINLSLQSGTKKLEKEAETRGMRPQGLSIKGRANRHNAGHSRHPLDDSTDEEPFLHDRRPQNDGPRHIRFDRFDPPRERPNRSRGGWYATDSFGRQRSRSPPPSQRHARNSRASSPQRDTYRPGTASSAGDSWRPPPPSNVARAGNDKRRPPPGPGSNIQINLPTRKGSNTWVNDGPAGSDSTGPTMERNRPPPNHAKRRKRR